MSHNEGNTFFFLILLTAHLVTDSC